MHPNTVAPVRAVLACPAWCTIDHATGGLELHSALLLDQDGVTLEAGCVSGQLAEVVIYVDARDGIPRSLSLAVASAVASLDDLSSAPARLLEIFIARPTPGTVRQVADGRQLQVVPAVPGARACDGLETMWQDGRDGFLSLHLDPFDAGCLESGSLILFVRPGVDAQRLEVLARAVMLDEAARWELQPDNIRAWELPLWLV